MSHPSPFMNWNKIRREAREVLERLHIRVDERKLVQDLTLAQKQMVLIARAIQSSCNFLILDEPTAPLSDTETAELFELVRRLRKAENVAIIFISHRINEIIQICENYTVMTETTKDKPADCTITAIIDSIDIGGRRIFDKHGQDGEN